MSDFGFNLTVTQAAAVLNRSPRAVRTLIESGKLAANEVGTGTRRKHYTIPPDAITAFRKNESTIVMREINDEAHRAVTRAHGLDLAPSFSRYADRARGARGR